MELRHEFEINTNTLRGVHSSLTSDLTVLRGNTIKTARVYSVNQY